MRTPRASAPKVVSIARLGVLVTALAGWLAGRPPPLGSRTAPASAADGGEAPPDGPPTPVYVGSAIYSPEAAVNRTLARFPAGHSPGEPAARLISRRTYYASFLGEPLETLGFTAEEMPPEEPIWLVGVPATGLTVGDVIDVPAAGTGVIQDERTADGMFYAWDARTGAPEGSGALIRGSVSSYETIVGLVSQDIPVIPPTLEIPPLQGEQP